MTSRYADIFSIMLSKCEAYEFVNMTESEFDEIMSEYLNVGISTPHVRNLFNSISVDDEIQTINWTLKNPIDDTSDKYFVENILAKSILCQWLLRQVNSQALIKQLISTSKEKYFSQQQHLTALKNLQQETERSLRYDIKAYVYLNTEL